MWDLFFRERAVVQALILARKGCAVDRFLRRDGDHAIMRRVWRFLTTN